MIRGKRGVLSEEGKILLPFKFKSVGLPTAGATFFLSNGILAFVVPSGAKFLVEDGVSQYGNELPRFSEGLAAVGSKSKTCGYIDQHARWVIPPKFDHAWDFVNGYAIVRSQDAHYIIDKSGDVQYKLPDVTVREDFRWPSDVFCFEAHTLDGTDRACIVASVERIFILKGVTQVGSVHRGVLPCRLGGGSPAPWQLRTIRNVPVGKLLFEWLCPFSEGLARAKSMAGRWGAINTAGEWVILPEFDTVGPSKSGFSIAERDGLKYVLNGLGRMVFTLSADEVGIGDTCLASILGDRISIFEFDGRCRSTIPVRWH